MEINLIRVRLDRHSLWHPRQDVEYEADDIHKICAMLSEDVEKILYAALNSDADTAGALNPLCPIMCKSDGSSKRSKWKNVSTEYELKVEVLISAVPTTGERKRVKRG